MCVCVCEREREMWEREGEKGTLLFWILTVWLSIPFSSCFRWGPERYEGWCRFQPMFFNNVFQAFNIISYPLIYPLKFHEVGMNRLGTLFPHQSESQVPTFKPGNNMILQKMHFWEDGSLWKISCSVKGICSYELQCCLCYDYAYLAVQFPSHRYTQKNCSHCGIWRKGLRP